MLSIFGRVGATPQIGDGRCSDAQGFRGRGRGTLCESTGGKHASSSRCEMSRVDGEQDMRVDGDRDIICARCWECRVGVRSTMRA